MILLVIFATEPRLVPDVGMLTRGRRPTSIWSTSCVDFGSAPRAAARGRRARAHRPVLDPDALLGHRDAWPRTTSRRRGPRACSDSAVLRRHALPNALLPTVTLVAINLGYIVAGAITVEVVFNWPGLGTLTVEALDGPRLPGAAGHLPAPVASSVVLANLVADIVYGVLDPRVRT